MLDLGELTCLMCHNMFNTTDRVPRLLAECGHTFCTACIAALLKGSTNGTFECPDDEYFHVSYI